MTVFELIEELKQFDPDAQVKVITENCCEQYDAMDIEYITDELVVGDDLIGMVFIEVQ